MKIPYRTRRTLGRAAVIVLVAALALTLIWLCWILWLGRYVVYTDEGARLDFNRSSLDITGEPALPPEDNETVSIYYNEGENAIEVSTELTQMTGYYISASDLKGDIAAIRTQLQALPAGTAVMVDVKNGYGEFFYSSTVSDNRNSDIDAQDMDALLDYLDKSGMYTVAKVTALQDRAYGLKNVDDGLFSTGGAYLWSDDLGCYWLNPAREGTISYLVQIVTELKNLGFDEVVFDEFYFPGSDGYRFDGDRYQTLTTAAGTLVSTCATESFAVSFVGDTTFPLPDGRSRLYVRGVEAADAAGVADSAAVTDKLINLVFLTDVHDTRFDTYSVLRPITAVR